MPVAAESPVTWHVILWVLLCLAINSMAQPSSKICGSPSRYRIYLSSSPIMVLADAISALIRLINVRIHLQTSLVGASQMVVQSRSTLRSAEGQDTIQVAPSRTWPRWLFFIMGPLPAVTKLASFSGIWWTKSWGLMFAVSFIVVELISFPSRTSSSTETPAQELPRPISQTAQSLNDHRSQKLAQNLDVIDSSLFLTATLVHLGLVIWAIEVLWSVGVDSMSQSALVQDIVLVARIFLLLISLAATASGMIAGLTCMHLEWPITFLLELANIFQTYVTHLPKICRRGNC